MRRGDVQRDVFDKVAETLVFCDKVSLAVYFNENTHFSLQMDVGSNHSFFGGSGCLLRGTGNPFLPEDIFGFIQIAAGLYQRSFTIHHAGACLLTQLLDEGRVYFRHKGFCVLSFGSCVLSMPSSLFPVRWPESLRWVAYAKLQNPKSKTQNQSLPTRQQQRDWRPLPCCPREPPYRSRRPT